MDYQHSFATRETVITTLLTSVLKKSITAVITTLYPPHNTR